MHVGIGGGSLNLRSRRADLDVRYVKTADCTLICLEQHSFHVFRYMAEICGILPENIDFQPVADN